MERVVEEDGVKHRCTYEGCGKMFKHRHHLLRHQNQNHGRMPRPRMPVQVNYLDIMPPPTMPQMNLPDARGLGKVEDSSGLAQASWGIHGINGTPLSIVPEDPQDTGPDKDVEEGIGSIVKVTSLSEEKRSTSSSSDELGDSVDNVDSDNLDLFGKDGEQE